MTKWAARGGASSALIYWELEIQKQENSASSALCGCSMIRFEHLENKKITQNCLEDDKLQKILKSLMLDNQKKFLTLAENVFRATKAPSCWFHYFFWGRGWRGNG